jgi:hypothetical protein
MDDIKNEVDKIINETVEEKKHIIIRIFIYVRNLFLCKSSCQKE